MGKLPLLIAAAFSLAVTHTTTSTGPPGPPGPPGPSFEVPLPLGPPGLSFEPPLPLGPPGSELPPPSPGFELPPPSPGLPGFSQTVAWVATASSHMFISQVSTSSGLLLLQPPFMSQTTSTRLGRLGNFSSTKLNSCQKEGGTSYFLTMMVTPLKAGISMGAGLYPSTCFPPLYTTWGGLPLTPVTKVQTWARFLGGIQ